MKHFPLISIITPSLNQGAYLEQAIQSVLYQDYENLEYIVIDGGSTDNSKEIIKKYQDRISYWHSRADNGQANAINQGFRMAKGDVVAWLNADDVYMQGTLRKIAERFRREPATDLIYGDCVYIDKHGSFIRYFHEFETYNRKRLLNFHDYISQPTTFFSMRMLKNVGLLDESFNYAMDWELWCRFAKDNANIHAMNEVLAANREYKSTKTNSGGFRRIKETWRVQKMHRECLWPHAFFGFLANEIVSMGRRNKNHFLRHILNWAGRSIAFLSPKAKWYWWKSENLRSPKYGLYPNSSKTNGNANIKLPLYKNRLINSVVVAVGIKGQQGCVDDQTKVRVQLGDKTVASAILGPKNRNKQFELDISKSAPYLDRLELAIKFESNGCPVEGHLYGVYLRN